MRSTRLWPCNRGSLVQFDHLLALLHSYRGRLAATMWVLVAQCVVVLLVGNCVFADESVPNCEGSPSEVWRNEGGPEECAEKAVCGDKWTMIRDWHNGTRCRDTRIVYNCQCPHAHDAPCPVNDDDYALHASRIHNQYLCQRACSLDKCSSNVRAAQEMVYHFRDNDPRRNYYRINCRCPRHDNIHSTNRRGGFGRTTTFRGLFWNYNDGLLFHQYGCSRRGNFRSSDNRCN